MDIKDTQRCHSNKTRLGMNETKYRCGFNITSCFHLSQSVSTIENFTSWMESLPQTTDSDSDHSQTKISRVIPRECESVSVLLEMDSWSDCKWYLHPNQCRYHLCCNWYAHTSFSGKRQDTTPSPLPCSNASSSMTLAFMNKVPHKYIS